MYRLREAYRARQPLATPVAAATIRAVRLGLQLPDPFEEEVGRSKTKLRPSELTATKYGTTAVHSVSRSHDEVQTMTLLQVMFVLATVHSATEPAMKSSGQTSSPDSKLYCVSRLLVPSFPYISKTSNSSGTLLAIVRLDHEGAVQSQQIDAVSSPGGSVTVKAFKWAIEQALKASSFSRLVRERRFD